jgi:hypothetical protein
MTALDDPSLPLVPEVFYQPHTDENAIRLSGLAFQSREQREEDYVKGLWVLSAIEKQADEAMRRMYGENLLGEGDNSGHMLLQDVLCRTSN